MSTIVVIRMGQSNSYGKASNSTLDPIFKTSFPNIKTWRGNAIGFNTLDWNTSDNRYPSENGEGGSEFAILKGLQELKGVTIYDIKYAMGGTYLGISQSPTINWNIATRGSYYDLAISTVNDAMNYLWNTLQLRDFKFYIFWDQGESDTLNYFDTLNYETNLINLITEIRKNIKSTNSINYFINPRINTTFPTTGNGITITGASNTSPIVLTVNGHSLLTGMQVTSSGVGGNTAANGTFTINVLSTSTFELNSSAGNGLYTSGGSIDNWVGRFNIRTAQLNVSNNIVNCYGYNTESFQLQADNLHYSNLGYKNKGDYAINNIISLNGL